MFIKNIVVPLTIFAIFLGLAFIIGVLFGVNYRKDMAAYHRGVYDGVQSTIFQGNRLLGDVDSQYRLRYTPEDDTYHLVIKPQGDDK